MSTGLIGGIAGSFVGIAGGLIGTYFSIKNTNGPQERRFMIRVSLVLWLGISIFLTALFLAPHARTWIWYPYFGILLVSIKYLNRRQQAIRQQEQQIR